MKNALKEIAERLNAMRESAQPEQQEIITRLTLAEHHVRRAIEEVERARRGAHS